MIFLKTFHFWLLMGGAFVLGIFINFYYLSRLFTINKTKNSSFTTFATMGRKKVIITKNKIYIANIDMIIDLSKNNEEYIFYLYQNNETCWKIKNIFSKDEKEKKEQKQKLIKFLSKFKSQNL